MVHPCYCLSALLLTLIILLMGGCYPLRLRWVCALIFIALFLVWLANFVDMFYRSTGLPIIRRSRYARTAFLRSRGYLKCPRGYVVDHIVPLFAGGTDSPDNMQLISTSKHRAKCVFEFTLRMEIQSRFL